jgi:hypothetical protein
MSPAPPAAQAGASPHFYARHPAGAVEGPGHCGRTAVPAFRGRSCCVPDRSPSAFVEKGHGLAPAPANVGNVDHPARVAAASRVAPRKFGILFSLSLGRRDSFISPRALTCPRQAMLRSRPSVGRAHRPSLSPFVRYSPYDYGSAGGDISLPAQSGVDHGQLMGTSRQNRMSDPRRRSVLVGSGPGSDAEIKTFGHFR